MSNFLQGRIKISLSYFDVTVTGSIAIDDSVTILKHNLHVRGQMSNPVYFWGESQIVK